MSATGGTNDHPICSVVKLCVGNQVGEHYRHSECCSLISSNIIGCFYLTLLHRSNPVNTIVLA